MFSYGNALKWRRFFCPGGPAGRNFVLENLSQCLETGGYL